MARGRLGESLGQSRRVRTGWGLALLGQEKEDLQDQGGEEAQREETVHAGKGPMTGSGFLPNKWVRSCGTWWGWM